MIPAICRHITKLNVIIINVASFTIDDAKYIYFK